MTECTAGCLVRSLAGHDRGELFIVLRADADYFYLADGRLRTVEKPKKKKRRHVQISGHKSRQISESLVAGKCVRDEEIKYFIKCAVQGGKGNV